jgi:acyl-coenzyme A synthetase/AMP-(fatty) acid ligase
MSTHPATTSPDPRSRRRFSRTTPWLSAVVGLPDEARGQIVTAFVVLREGVNDKGPSLPTELQDFVKQRIAPYKYPRRVVFVDELPRTNTGKLQRFRLRTDQAISTVDAS